MKSRTIKVGTDAELEEVMRMRFIYGRTPSQIGKRLKLSADRVRELIIAATYYGLGLSEGRKKI